jgi:hypothetical protein
MERVGRNDGLTQQNDSQDEREQSRQWRPHVGAPTQCARNHSQTPSVEDDRAADRRGTGA